MSDTTDPERPSMQLFESVAGGAEDCNAASCYPSVERRAGWHDPGSCVNMQIVEQRFADGSARMGRIEKALAENTAATTEIRDILQLGKAFFRLADLFGKLVKWGAAVAVPLLAVYTAIKSDGKLP